jgi:hypothetical protein
MTDLPQRIPAKYYEPNEDHARLARNLAGIGIPQKMIAAQIGLEVKTLQKHYSKEMEEGAARAASAVAKRLYDIAMGDGKEALTACIFWLKCRAGWRTTDVEQHLTQLNIQNNVVGGQSRTDDEIERFKDRWQTIGVDSETVSE